MIQTLKCKAANIALAGIIACACVGAATATALTSTATNPTIAHANEWKYSNGGWWYQLNSYQFAIDRWNINGKIYYFDNNGWMQTGWQKIYNQWYYFNKSGAAVTGWQKINRVWYYFNDNGIMTTGWNRVNGTWYYHNKSGAMQTGWQKVGGKWYYLKQSGAMAANIQIDKYYLTSDGSMAANQWIGDRFFQKDGTLATNQWIGNYHVNEKGIWDASRNALFGNKYYDSNSKEVVFTGKHSGSFGNSSGNLGSHIPEDSTMTVNFKSYNPSVETYTVDITFMTHFHWSYDLSSKDRELSEDDAITTISNIEISEEALLEGGTLWKGPIEHTFTDGCIMRWGSITLTSSGLSLKNGTVRINSLYDLGCSEHVDTFMVKLI